MRRLLVGLAFSFVVAAGVVHAQDDKPLGPGWLSLDSSVGVLDKSIGNAKSALEKVLGISISGYLDTGWTYSSNRPRNPDYISGRYFDRDHNDIVFNGFNITIDKPEKDWGVGFHIAGDFGRTGEFLREATFYGVNKFRPGGVNGGESSAELREAFLTTTIPIGEGLQIKGGLWVTTLGTEIIPNPGAYNDNISRSFLFNLAIPFRHLGVLLSYPVMKSLSLSAGMVTGWDNPHDNNNQPSFLGGVTITPSDSFSFFSNIIVGPEQTNTTGPKRLAWANVWTIKPIDPLAFALEYTYGHEERVTASARDGTWQGWGAIASYSWTNRFATALRGEVFKDSDGVRTGAARDVTLSEVTATASYKFTKMLLGRMEVRQDWANEKILQRGSSSADKNQTTAALQLIYTY